MLSNYTINFITLRLEIVIEYTASRTRTKSNYTKPRQLGEFQEDTLVPKGK